MDNTRILVCGGREYDDWYSVEATLDHYTFYGSTIIHGNSIGADFLARVYAKYNSLKEERYPALWKVHGTKAGPIRNQQMLDEGKPTLVIAFPGGSGTADMVTRAKKAGVEVLEVKDGS